MWLAVIFYMLEEAVRHIGLLWNKDWDLVFTNKIAFAIIWTVGIMIVLSIINNI